MSKTIARKGAGDRETLIYLLIYSNKLAYLQLIGFGLRKQFSQKSFQGLAKTLKIRVNEFIFRTCNFIKNELFIGYFSRILIKSFSGFVLIWNFHTFTDHLFEYL